MIKTFFPFEHLFRHSPSQMLPNHARYTPKMAKLRVFGARISGIPIYIGFDVGSSWDVYMKLNDLFSASESPQVEVIIGPMAKDLLSKEKITI